MCRSRTAATTAPNAVTAATAVASAMLVAVTVAVAAGLAVLATKNRRNVCRRGTTRLLMIPSSVLHLLAAFYILCVYSI